MEEFTAYTVERIKSKKQLVFNIEYEHSENQSIIKI